MSNLSRRSALKQGSMDMAENPLRTPSGKDVSLRDKPPCCRDQQTHNSTTPLNTISFESPPFFRSAHVQVAGKTIATPYVQEEEARVASKHIHSTCTSESSPMLARGQVPQFRQA
jgi:hypothetical protein